MEYLKSFLSDIQERFRNPLIGSFIISWLFFNWEITFLIIHFFTDSNSKLDFNGFIDKVNSLTNNWHSIYFPLISSILYVTAFPFIRNYISYLQAWFTTKRNALILKGSKEASVSVTKYLTLREEYVEKLEYLKEIISNEGEYKVKALNLEAEIVRKEDEVRNLVIREREFSARRNNSKLNGFWEFEIVKRGNEDVAVAQGGTPSYVLKFDGRQPVDFNIDTIELNGNLINFYKRNSQAVTIKGNIIYYDYDTSPQSIGALFIYAVCAETSPPLSSLSDNSFHLIFQLKQEKDFTYLSGTINSFYSIVMKRKGNTN